MMRRLLIALALVAPVAQATVIVNPFVTHPTAAPGGSAALTWRAPSLNADGGALSLSGYKIYKAPSTTLTGGSTYMGAWTLVATVANPAAVSYTVTGLASGKWFFKVNPYNANGEAGDGAAYSVTKTIP